jgi:predicted GNAT superfamily acetyltransferase
VNAPAPAVTIRELSEFDDLRRCVDFQQEIWGAGFNELVPAAILWVASNTGGIVAAAMDDGDRFAGFIFGITGWRDGEPVHWSDMLAVRPDLRGRGIGLMLKRHQRDTLLARGVHRAVWTFDPLESRNAWLNLTRLGATTGEYLRDCYGPSTSPLHSLGTDRVLVRWSLSSPRVRQRMDEDARPGPAPDDAPEVNPAGREPDLDLDAEQVRLRVPADIQALKAADPDAAREWRRITRTALEAYFGRGYEARELVRESSTVSSYLLTRRPATDM